MKLIIKDLLDEMIQYRTTRTPIKYLKKSFDEIGKNEIFSINSNLLLWHKMIFLKIDNPVKFEITDLLYKKYIVFFDKCPELNEVFTLHETYIGWASVLDKTEQDEILNYIYANYKVQIRIRMDDRLKNK